MPRALYTLLLTLFLALPVSAQQKHADTEKLGMALEYFASGKYHEALLLFQRLDKTYKLNARFRAYIGLCYYHEWEYDKACQYLDELIPQLSALAPHERSVYYYAAAESHFNLQQYEAAIPYYEQVLGVCYDREKGDVFYLVGVLLYVHRTMGKRARQLPLVRKLLRQLPQHARRGIAAGTTGKNDSGMREADARKRLVQRTARHHRFRQFYKGQPCR